MTPKYLGRLAPIDDARLEPGFVLWERFCVIDPPRETEGQLIVAVTDLEGDFGGSLDRRLELHRLPAPTEEERPRWLRGLGVSSRVQARVYAYAETGDGTVVSVCEPAVGKPIEIDSSKKFELGGRRLLVFAFELTGLLRALHETGVHGVRFALERLRVDDDHYSVDGLTHLRLPGEDDDELRDLAALVELIRRVGGEAAESLIEPPPTSAMELWERLRTRDGAGGLDEIPSEPPFVGREAGLSRLSEGFDQAQIAKPTTLIVRGQRGVGKSRLLREFAARRLQADDSLVITGAWEGQSADTRGGLLGALDQLTRVLSRLDPDERDDIRVRINYAARGVGAIVARSAPSLGSVLRRVEELPPLELGEDFTRHTAVIAELFRTLGTRKRPLVLVLDNLESADSSSIAVLKILGEARPAHHSLILLGFRTDGGTRTSLDLDAVDIELSLLRVEEVTELLTQTLPGTVENIDSIAKSLWSGTNGLPLAIWGSLRAWLDHGSLSRSVDDGVWRARQAGTGHESEASVRALFGARLAAAPKAIPEFALHAAVLGTELTDDEVRDLGGRLETNPDVAITDLVGLGILIRCPGGVRFPHSSILELVLESADESERRAAHRRVAQMLTERQAPVAQVAYHRDLAFDPDTADSSTSDRLSRLHVEAGRERLGVYDLERARWHLERALEHSHDSEQRGVAAEGLADICLLLKDLDTAVSLYTAIIATSEGIQPLQIAAKVAQYLFFQSGFTEGRQLGAMAFEQIDEPHPTTPLGHFSLFLGSAIRSWFGPSKLDPGLRDALVRVHLWLAQMSFIDDPLAVLAHVARGRWLAKGLETAAAAMLTSLEAFMWGAALGRYDYGNQLFAKTVEITTNPAKAKDVWAEGYIRHNWTLHLFASNRYEEAQDMGDDAIGALREAGDVSATALTILFKGMYGRDREPADRILRWFDEAISTSRRNGKTLCLISLECLKLHIFARQGRMELKPRLIQASDSIDRADAAIDRLIARTHLAFAAYECSEYEIGVGQIHKALVEFAEGPGVPEFCQDFYLVATLILMELPNPSRADRKLSRSTQRKFRGFAKRSPRLHRYNDLLDLKLALKVRDTKKIRATASKIVAEVEIHENLYMTHYAHRALSNLLKGENVLAAAEHERMAHKYGRQLGLPDFMQSTFAEVRDEMLELGIETESKFEESHASAAAGMLTPTGKLGRTPVKQAPRYRIDEQSDVLAAWALTGHDHVVQTALGTVLDPVHRAVSGSISEKNLKFSCPTPNTVVPIESSSLQVLVINMLLACQDTLDSDAKFSVRIEDEQIDSAKSLGRVKKIEPGHYLTIRVAAHGITQNTLIGGFVTCESLVDSLGGQLSASTDKTSATLTAHIPLIEDTTTDDTDELPVSVIVHPDPAIREALGAALDKLGARWRAFEPHEFGPTNIEHAKVILADSGSLDDLVVLGPLLDARLVEILTEGDVPAFYDQEQLYFPVVLSALENVLRRS